MLDWSQLSFQMLDCWQLSFFLNVGLVPIIFAFCNFTPEQGGQRRRRRSQRETFQDRASTPRWRRWWGRALPWRGRPATPSSTSCPAAWWAGRHRGPPRRSQCERRRPPDWERFPFWQYFRAEVTKIEPIVLHWQTELKRGQCRNRLSFRGCTWWLFSDCDQDHDERFILNMLLGDARPGDASAATKSTKGGDEGRQHLGGTVYSKGETCPRYPCLHCCLVFVLGTIDTTWLLAHETCYLKRFVHLRPFARLGHIFHVSTSAAKETKHLSCLKRPPRVITEYTDKSQRDRRHKIVIDWRRYRRNQILMSRKGRLIFVKFIWYNILYCIFKRHQITYFITHTYSIQFCPFWMSSLTRSYNMYMK